jgi:hypothetical protein
MSRAKKISEEMSGISTEVEKNSTTKKVLRRRKVLLEVCIISESLWLNNNTQVTRELQQLRNVLFYI